jgi:hypothetical protein
MPPLFGPYRAGTPCQLDLCVVRVVRDLRERRVVLAASGIVSALVLLHLARLVYLLAGL